jgi:hypothetical protein
MTTAHDIYSETNPAFCACALAAFTKTYLSIRANGPEVPIAYLSLPGEQETTRGQMTESTKDFTSRMFHLGESFFVAHQDFGLHAANPGEGREFLQQVAEEVAAASAFENLVH